MASRQLLRMRRESAAFALGSLLFVVAPWPWYVLAVGIPGVNATFLVGALLFVTGSVLQLTLTGRHPPRERATPGDRLHWWTAVVRLAGGVVFTVSTLVALLNSVGVAEEAPPAWTADAWGSVLFLASGVLGIAVLQRRRELRDFGARTPGSVWLAFAGSLAFTAAAIGGLVIPDSVEMFRTGWTNVGTAAGGACFFASAVMTRPAVTAPDA